ASTTLEAAVSRVLSQGGRSAGGRMRELAWLCFAPDLRPAHVNGDWEGLEAALQARVLAVARQGLEEGTPTPVPDGPAFPGVILCEAWASLRVLEDPEQPGWLTAERVRRWLPTAVFGLYEHIPALARRCAAVDHAATVAIVLDAAERELRRGTTLPARAG